MGKLRTLLLDKTGTLTQGKLHVTRIKTFNGLDEKDVLYTAAIAEKRSEHPLGKAIIERAEKSGFAVPHPETFEDFKGKGVRVRWDSRTIAVGGPGFLRDEGVEIPDSVQKLREEKESEGMTSLLVASDRRLLGLISLSDTLREGAKEVLDKIKAERVPEIWMLTGDNEQVAHRIARELGIHYEARLYPEDKVRKVKEWRKTGRVVAMVGDGVNDAPALAAADIGIAMGAAGTDVAIETADVALMTDELENIPVLIRLSRKSLRVIKENLGFAIGFNTVLVVLSAYGLIPMILGAILHQASSLLVIFNSMRLLRKAV
jgi:heavy metal translocating P-type ATPase